VTEKFLARYTTPTLEATVAGKKGVIALMPIGSTELRVWRSHHAIARVHYWRSSASDAVPFGSRASWR
jgi:hypothetical protein